MNRHIPTISRFQVAGTPTRIYTPSDGARSLAVIFENHGTSAIRLLFTDTGKAPDVDAYLTIPAGRAIEANPAAGVFAFSPSGTPSPVVVVIGVRYVGSIDPDADPSVSAVADQLAAIRGQKQLLAQIEIQQRIMLRYFSEWQGEVFTVHDAIDVL